MNSPQLGPIASRVVPCGLAFIASFCIMVIELVAGRVIARHVGSSLYTWTSVIGIVLGGITVGNLVGGRLADWFNTRKTLAVLFLLAAATASVIPLVNSLVGTTEWLIKLPSWRLRIAMHVTFVFLIPSSMLGLIGPVVAKMALDQGRSTGKTVGNVYAWGAIGSIAGTFMTGFTLIPHMGTTTVVLSVAGVLALVGLSLLPFFAWPLAAAFLLGTFIFSGSWGYTTSQLEWDPEEGWFAVREKLTGSLVYVDESQYSYIQVSEETGSRRTRELVLDHLVHAYYVPEEPLHLEYEYERVYAAITAKYMGDGMRPRSLFLGGGGYVFPRYMATRWPDGWVEVAEIDPGVTRAVMEAMGLREDEVRIVEGRRDAIALAAAAEREARRGPETRQEATSMVEARTQPIWIYHLDARNHVEDLVRRKRMGLAFEPFDFVYGDAFNHFSVPFHLVTLEFTQMIREVLREETGIYLLNVIDTYASGRFLGAVLCTFREVFPRTYVLSTTSDGPDEREGGRDTFVVVGAFRDLDLADLAASYEGAETLQSTLLEETHLRQLDARADSQVLTDEYSPVENLLEAVLLDSASDEEGSDEVGDESGEYDEEEGTSES